MMEFRTVKRIDNSRLVRNVEPAKQRNLYKTVGAGGVVALFFLFPQWRSARGGPSPASPREEMEAPRLKRLAADTLLVPPEVQPALDLRTVPVVPATRSRVLPSLTGTLALDTNRLVRVGLARAKCAPSADERIARKERRTHR